MNFNNLKLSKWKVHNRTSIVKECILDGRETKIGLFGSEPTGWRFFINHTINISECIELEDLFVKIYGKMYFQKHELKDMKTKVVRFIKNIEKLKAFI
jgi:hypothetical protein